MATQPASVSHPLCTSPACTATSMHLQHVHCTRGLLLLRAGPAQACMHAPAGEGPA